jgi:transcriptional regulator with XRE-family HTH domain
MQFFSSNLEFLRKQKGLKQSEILDFIGIEQTRWSNYEKGKSFPNLKIFNEISSYFGVNAGDLLNVDLSKVDLKQNENMKIFHKKDDLKVDQSVDLIPYKRKMEGVSSMVGEYQANVYNLDSRAAAGVAAIIADADKQHLKPSICLPYLGPGFHIRLQITGDSMHATIKDGDFLIATHLPEPLQTLREGYIYAIIDKEDGIVCKRVYKAGKDTLEFESDNDVYKPYKRHLSDILAIFKVVEVHTTDLRNYYSDTRRDINKLFKEVEAIKNIISK